MDDKDLLSNLVENAFDFLVRAIDEFEDEPKFSIIHFYTAIELFLKARLFKDHWSLLVLKDADRKKFEIGDFNSVSFEVACERLRKVVQSPVSDQTYKTFDAIRQHRNKMVHFFHDKEKVSKENVRQIAIEQLIAWAGLHHLLTSQWASTFAAYAKRFDDIERSLKKHRDYLQAKYDQLLPSIEAEKAAGIIYIECSSCHFEAAPAEEVLGEVHDATCKLCGYNTRFFHFVCLNCDERSPYFDGGSFVCSHCDHILDEQATFDQINQHVVTSDNYSDCLVPGNCSDCGVAHTVAEYEGQYLCVNCLVVYEGLETCDWCGEGNTGDMEGSGWSGCSVCDGKAGDMSDD